MAHLMGVAALVMGESGYVPFPVTEDMVIAALLHDAVEDHGGLTRLEDIRCNFGAEVAHMVEGLSDSFEEDSSAKEELGKNCKRVATWSAWPMNPGTSSSSRLPTSSTTHELSWMSTGPSAPRSGNASIVAATSRCGTSMSF